VGLTSGLFLWLAITVAAGAIAGTTWLWPRLACQRIGQVGARITLIALGQILIVAAVLTYLNDSFSFFSSWSALLGRVPAQQRAVSLPGTARAARTQPIVITGSSIGTTYRGVSALGQNGGGLIASAGVQADAAGVPLVAGHSRAPALTISAAARSGAVLRVTIRGQYTGIVGASDYVYLPPAYFQPAYAGARFPVVLAFAGYPTDPLNVVRTLLLPAIASRLGTAHRIRPAIYVMVNPSVALPRDTECTNIPAGLQVATFFATDVPLAVMRTFRAQSRPTGWAAIGFSTGAYCAAKMAMLYPGQFSAAVGMSGIYSAIRDHTTGNLYGGSRGYQNENDLQWRLRHLPAPPVSVLIASSAGEDNLPSSLRFLRLIHPPMQGYSLILQRGGHNYSTWRRELPQALAWLSRRLTPPARGPKAASEQVALSSRHAVRR
jgi:enterochelin esterase-like enzyme